MEESFKVPEFVTKAQNAEEKPDEPEIPYKIPKWSGEIPKENYSFEVLKNGVIVDQVESLNAKPFWMIGRLPLASGVDITAAHPTVSRFHAVLQYKDSTSAQEGESDVQCGWFIYDLGELCELMKYFKISQAYHFRFHSRNISKQKSC